MKQLVYFLSLFFTFVVQAQNVTEKTFSAQNITSIDINGDSIFNITLETIATDQINIKSRIEGENSEHVILVTEIKSNTLYVSVKKQPLFIDANDKLSALKVVSIAIHLVIPKNLKVFLNSDISNIIVKGQYKKTVVDLQFGNCFFSAFQGDAEIRTIQGNIIINTNFAIVLTETQNGFVKAQKIDSGKNNINAKTINGNITLTKSQ